MIRNASFVDRYLSLIVIATMLLASFPLFPRVAEAADDIFGPNSATVSTSTPYTSGSIDATGYNNLTLTFEYEHEALDNGDSFTYDVMVEGVSVEADTIDGVNADTITPQLVSVDLSSYPEANDIELVVTVSADTSTDEVNLTNITLEGEPIGDAPTVSPCTLTTEVVTTDLTTWDLSETRATGHNEITADGLHVWTEGTASTDKAAGYYEIDFALVDLGDQTIDEALDYDADLGIEPGLQLVVDFNNDGTVDGILVGEKIYGEDWWLTGSSASFVKDDAPNTGGGSGSNWFGTANEWLAEFPDAQVTAIGYSLGSGVHGDGVIKSINLGCTEFTFEKESTTDIIEVFENTSAGENLPGWMFNRDAGTDTPIEFNDNQASIGDGALYVLPVGANAADKFVGENFINTPIADVESISYDFMIGNGGDSTDEEQFYMNIYANFGESNDLKFYDCRYNVIPTTGSTGDFTTVTFDPTENYTVKKHNTSPHNCPASPADMDDLSPGSNIRMFALNLGDSTTSDVGLNGYFDNVVTVIDEGATVHETTYDFEPNPNVDPNNENVLNVGGAKFHNRNGDRDQDAGEENLSGWGMRLYREVSTSTWQLIATTTTGVDGAYKFPSQQAAGVYHTCEVAQLGWTQVRQDWGGTQYDVKTDNISPNASEEGPYCTTIEYPDVKDLSNAKRIGNLMNDPNNENQFSQIGIKFNNKNGDRDQDDGEEVLPGWTFNFYKEVNGAWEFIASAVTADDGKYSFPQQTAPGVYHVCEVLQSGWEQVYQDWEGTPYHITTENQSPNAATEGPWCSTTTYTDEADRSNARYFGNIDQPDASLTITAPSTDGEVIGGEFTFEAEYIDADDNDDPVQWAIRAGSCTSSTDTVAGNVDGFNTTFMWNGADFSATVDTTDWDNGEYCFVVNPTEDSGTNFRETRLFTLENIVALSCEAGVNLLANASFEEPDITGDSNGWELVDSEGWLAERVGSGVDVLMEIQRGNTGEIAWSSSDGNQMIELDGEESSAFSQIIPTIADKEYTLTWDFSPRPGSSLGVNQLEVFIDGAEVASNQADGTANANTDWNTYSYNFVGDGNDVELTFADAGASDGYGALLDNVVLSCNPDTGTINYCGDGEVNGYEQCELGDANCNSSCQLANQCHEDQLVKITLNDTVASSESWNGKVYLGDENKIAPVGYWFSVDEFGDETAADIAGAGFEGLAMEYDGSEMKLAWRGENSSGDIDYVQGDLEFMGFDDIVADDIEPEINGTQFNLEDSDVFDLTSSSTIEFDMRADVGNDGVTLTLRDGEMCTVDPDEAPAVPSGLGWRDSNGTNVADGGTTDLISGVAFWDASSDADFSHYIYHYWNNIPTSAYNSEANAWVADNISTNELPGSFNQGEGTHYFCVIAVDDAGNESACSDEFTIIYDTDPTVPPTPTSTFGTTTVTSSAMNGWAFFTENVVGGQSGELVFGPTGQPLGLGSAQFILTAADEAQALGTTNYAGTALKDITALTYNTYRASSADPAQAVALSFEFDNDVTDADSGWRSRMVYEPYHAHSVSTGVWEEWNTQDNALNGNWWGSPNALSTLDEVCPQSNPCTWNEVLTAFPNAGIRDAGAGTGLLLFKAGSGWANFNGNIDELTVGVQTGTNTHTEVYDFEPTDEDDDNNSNGGGGGGGGSNNNDDDDDGPTPQVLGASTDDEIYELLENIKDRISELLVNSYITYQNSPFNGSVLGASVVQAQGDVDVEVEMDEATTTPEADEEDDTDDNITEDEEDLMVASWMDWICNYIWLLPLVWIVISGIAYWRKESMGDLVMMLWVQAIFGGLAVISLLAFMITGVPCSWLPSAIVALGSAAMAYFGRGE